MVSRSLLIFTLHSLLSMGDFCGAGGGGGGSSGQSEGQKIFEDIYNAVKFIPGNSGDFTEGFVTDYINGAMQKVLKGDIKVGHYTSGSSENHIKCPSDLNCDFSKPCRWANAKTEDLDFYTATGHPDSTNLGFYTGTSSKPDTPSLLTAGNRGSKAAWLVSDTISEQRGNGLILFRYWASPLIEIRICTKKVGSSELTTCSNPFVSTNNSGPVKANIVGPIREPFQVSIHYLNPLTRGFAIIDDIVYSTEGDCISNIEGRESPSVKLTKPSIAGASSADIGKETNEKLTKSQAAITDTITTEISESGTGGSESIASNEISQIARLLDCTFDDGPCNYDISASDVMQSFQWQRGPIGNIHTGIKYDTEGNFPFTGGYLVANGDMNRLRYNNFVAISPTFELRSTVKLQFYRWQSSAESLLKICINSLQNCPWSFSSFMRDWSYEEIKLSPKSLHLPSNRKVKIILSAEGLQRNGYLAIDQIQITQAKKHKTEIYQTRM